MTELWNVLLYQPFVNLLMLLYQLLFHNFGLAIIVLTVALRTVLIPLTLPSMKSAEKMRQLAPELERLKKKYGSDKQAFAKAQMDFYRQQGINPAAGCLPQIVQLVILIALYQAFIQVLNPNAQEVVRKLNTLLYQPLKLAEDTVINTQFLWLNLAKPDVIKVAGLGFPLPGLFLIAAALIQLISSKMMMPVLAAVQKDAAQTPEKTDDMATSMQTQMTYLFPLMTILIGFTFPSGLVLYWFIFSLFTAVQQYFVSGWGGLTPWINKLKIENGKFKIKDH
ncbi:hypothetical protein COT65_00200 [Candidatus Shapirobacteria bacterium CG09_land_8_20_14_0_10_47_13]|uniref:Membrane insertase YidC/Oxa/ALB C-terminal domain-containing protein n=1 Tax=Candidatus Shapirobacteria bacterium CG09_land_8_20_14_0_10_47_13 TaxID=1974481 RepID=A0A2H0WNK2_9BACT|nr:MAG: hypothetical protein COT65_00200 [Candidatus Shapirobacteria bacterium CG09_land_8_20_14_0_10_47_13]